ncbi:MAG TPA: hypothetical protein VN380_12475 [Thermoanaerobaculia bacterium]|jgi:hypothetical protein|nr:hypothetical protein [Thermoanaerobaculia bacterium]
MKPTPGSCLVVLGSLLVTIVWLVLLLSSLFFAPKRRAPSIRQRPDPAAAAPATMRMLERMLIVTSVLMILATLVFYLGARSMQP